MESRRNVGQRHAAGRGDRVFDDLGLSRLKGPGRVVDLGGRADACVGCVEAVAFGQPVIERAPAGGFDTACGGATRLEASGRPGGGVRRLA